MVRVILVTPFWRLVGALLVLVTLASLPTYALALFLLPPVPLPVMIRSFAVGSGLPALLAWLLARAFGGTVSAADGTLHLSRGDVAIDLACDAIVAVRPWWVPLPCAGVVLRLRSGRTVPLRLAARNPRALLEMLARAGAPIDAARRHPTLVYAATRRPWSWWWAIVKFPLFGAVPASVLFYTHQHIAYGGTFGEYYLEGLGPYLATFTQYWFTTVVLLVSYASFWRGAAETAVWITGAMTPERAALARRVAEIACTVAYYAGVPLMLALRYMD